MKFWKERRNGGLLFSIDFGLWEIIHFSSGHWLLFIFKIGISIGNPMGKFILTRPIKRSNPYKRRYDGRGWKANCTLLPKPLFIKPTT